MNKTAVFYHFYDLNKSYRENMIYFLSTALQADADFFIITAGKILNFDFPEYSNLSIIETNNINLDYGGYCQAITILGKQIEKYDNVFFVNSSVRGPFIETKSSDWMSLFISRLNEKNHLVGSSINILDPRTKDSKEYHRLHGGEPPFTHVQTTAYAMSAYLLKALISQGFYSQIDPLKKSEVIFRYEIGLSQRAMDYGSGIDAILPRYQGHNYLTLQQDFNPTSRSGDPLRRGGYFGKTPKPRELVFIKTNRRLIPSYLLDWHTLIGLLRVNKKTIKTWHEYQALKSRLYLRLTKIPLCTGALFSGLYILLT